MATATNGGFNLPADGQANVVTEISSGLQALDNMVAGRLVKSVSASHVLNSVEARNAVMEFTGALAGDIIIDLPAAAGTGRSRRILVYNNTTGGFNVTLRHENGSGVGAAVPAGFVRRVWHNGSSVLGEGQAYNPLTGFPLPVAPTARVYRTADQSIPNNAGTAVAFTAERFDNNSIHDNVTNNTRLTCRTAGRYLVGACVHFDVSATGGRGLWLLLNGVTSIWQAFGGANATASQGTTVALATLYDLNVNDYVEVIAFQNSGGALNAKAIGNYSPEFYMVWAG